MTEPKGDMKKGKRRNRYGICNWYIYYASMCSIHILLFELAKMKYNIMLRLDNWNDIINQNRVNKYCANSNKQKEMKDISWFIRKIPKIEKYPIELIFRWHIKNSRADLDNKSVKSILDEMQNLGILENDNMKHISKITHIAVPDKTEYVEMEIIEC